MTESETLRRDAIGKRRMTIEKIVKLVAGLNLRSGW